MNQPTGGYTNRSSNETFSSSDSIEKSGEPSLKSDSSSNYLAGPVLFVVSRSILSSIVPSLLYLVFILLITSFSSFDLSSIAFIGVFALAAILPILFSPRRYEFYDDYLRIHKTVGRDSIVQYSDLTIFDQSLGNRPRIVLGVTGQRRQILISGNPRNETLNQSLSDFLSTKLKVSNPKSSMSRNKQDSVQLQNSDSFSTEGKPETNDEDRN